MQQSKYRKLIADTIGKHNSKPVVSIYMGPTIEEHIDSGDDTQLIYQISLRSHKCHEHVGQIEHINNKCYESDISTHTNQNTINRTCR